MEISGLKCNGCGSTNVKFDEKARLLICYQCGKEEPFSRHDFANNDKVVITKDNAMKFFLDGKLEDAHKYAQDVLNIMLDNIPALYIMAYFDEMVSKKMGSLKHFFEQVEEIKDVDYHEVRDMLRMFEATAAHLIDFEKEILTFAAVNMQSAEDEKELCDFVDRMCPFFISRRTSMDFFKYNREIYYDFARHCGIPKTCYALMKAITENPDSPYKNKRFDLEARNRYFFDYYVVPVGDIIHDMNFMEMKQRFTAYYAQVKTKYAEDTKL